MKPLFLSVIFLFSILTTAQDLLVKNASIVDVSTGKLIPKQHILVENGIIKKISSKKIKQPYGI